MVLINALCLDTQCDTSKEYRLYTFQYTIAPRYNSYMCFYILSKEYEDMCEHIILHNVSPIQRGFPCCCPRCSDLYENLYLEDYHLVYHKIIVTCIVKHLIYFSMIFKKYNLHMIYYHDNVLRKFRRSTCSGLICHIYNVYEMYEVVLNTLDHSGWLCNLHIILSASDTMGRNVFCLVIVILRVTSDS